EIEGPDGVLALLEELLELIPALVGFCVYGNVEQPPAEFFDFRFVVFARLQVRLQRLAGEGPIFLVRKRAARRTDDARRLQELPFDLPMIEGRQQLPFGKVTRTAEDDAIKGIDRNDLAA